MRNQPISLSSALFGKAKRAALGVLFSNPESPVHLRELARRAGVSATMIGKEMDTLALAGIVIERKDGNRRVFQANAKCPIFAELKSIAQKTSGIAELIHEALKDLRGIESSFIFGSVAKGTERAESDVDLCIVGRVSHNDVLTAIAGVERAIGRTINPVIYSPEEFGRKSADGNPLVAGMLSGARIAIIGDAYESAREFGKSGGSRKPEAAKPKRGGHRQPYRQSQEHAGRRSKRG